VRKQATNEWTGARGRRRRRRLISAVDSPPAVRRTALVSPVRPVPLAYGLVPNDTHDYYVQIPHYLLTLFTFCLNYLQYYKMTRLASILALENDDLPRKVSLMPPSSFTTYYSFFSIEKFREVASRKCLDLRHATANIPLLINFSCKLLML
jgi:hypothetical protein